GSTACTARRARCTTALPARAGRASSCGVAPPRARSRPRGARRLRARPRADRPTSSSRSHELAEAVAHEPVEVDREGAVGPGELTEVHEEERPLFVEDGVRACRGAGEA